MRYFLSIAAALCLCTIAFEANAASPRTDANVYGHVVDRETGEHLPFINVAVPGTTLGTTTDESGHFFLKNLPEGRLNIEASAVGYRPLRLEAVLRRDTTIELNFEIEQERVEVEKVVVSASRSEEIRHASPSLVHVMDGELFERANAACLAEGLGFQPGVRVEDDCQNCGFKQVRINGLDGHYSQILIDSHPVFSALSGVYGLEQIPASMIERVEIIRGGGSALVGAAAIGGTINVVTRDPVGNSAQAGHTLTAIGGDAYDNATSMNASVVSDDTRMGLALYGQVRHRSGYDHDGDGFTELPVLKSNTAGLRSFLRTGAYSRLTLQYHGTREYRRGGDRLDLPPHQAQVAEQTDHSIHSGSLGFDLLSADRTDRLHLYASFQQTSRNSYYGSGQDPDAYGRTHDLTLASGAQYVHGFDRLLFMPSELTLGAEYNHDRLEDESLGYDYRSEQRVHILSAYLQNEWKNDRWALLVGGRIDKHNMVDRAIFSPRVNLRYNPAREIDIRLSYASGFRAPQAFDEDMHVAIVGGERVRIRLSEDLKEEKSHSISLSADLYHNFGALRTNLLMEGFFTDLDDVFALRELAAKDADGATVKERYNGSGARVAGVNVEAKAAYAWIELQGGMTWQRSRYKQPEYWSGDKGAAPEKRMFRTPDLYGYLTACVTPVRAFDIDLTGTYSGSMLVQHMAGSGTPVDRAVTTPAFFDLNVKLSCTFRLCRSVSMQLHAGVQNLFDAYQNDFDRGADRDSGYVYGPSLPRSWFAGVKFSF